MIYVICIHHTHTNVCNRYPTIPACVVALCGIALIILGVVYPKGSLPHGSPTLAELQQKHHMAWAELLRLDPTRKSSDIFDI